MNFYQYFIVIRRGFLYFFQFKNIRRAVFCIESLSFRLTFRNELYCLRCMSQPSAQDIFNFVLSAISRICLTRLCCKWFCYQILPGRCTQGSDCRWVEALDDVKPDAQGELKYKDRVDGASQGHVARPDRIIPRGNQR